jgi:hypothetical protein
MPFSELDEIPPDAGQYFAPCGAHCYVVFNTDTANAFYVYARLYGNHISGFKSNGLASRNAGLLVHFQSQAVTGAMDEVGVETALLQHAASRRVYVATGCPGLHGANRRLLR